jgi:citrate synthase
VSALRQTMGHSEPDRIEVRGHDLCTELIGKIDFASMLYLEITGRLPSAGEARLVDASLVTLVEHGITPSALAARLTHLGSPGALQGAVAAGILGAGETFLGAIEQCAEVLQELRETDDIDGYLDGVIGAGGKVPGIGHPFHRPVDPRTPVLFALAEECLDDTPHIRLLTALQERAADRFGKDLPVNADGAIAAILSDVGLSWRVCRGFAVVSRSAGIVGHLHDEASAPIGRAVWDLVEEHVPYERPRGRDDHR